jgi:hypothetical protein
MVVESGFKWWEATYKMNKVGLAISSLVSMTMTAGKNEIPSVRIPPGCKVFRTLYISDVSVCIFRYFV